MDFRLSEEQAMLQDSIQKWCRSNYTFDARRAIVDGEEGFSRDNWREFAEMGWLAVPFAEEDGGFGGGPGEVMLLMEQFGRALVVEPYLATVILISSRGVESCGHFIHSFHLSPLSLFPILSVLIVPRQSR